MQLCVKFINKIFNGFLYIVGLNAAISNYIFTCQTNQSLDYIICSYCSTHVNCKTLISHKKYHRQTNRIEPTNATKYTCIVKCTSGFLLSIKIEHLSLSLAISLSTNSSFVTIMIIVIIMAYHKQFFLLIVSLRIQVTEPNLHGIL